MEIVFNYNDADYNIDLRRNVIFFGQNNTFKSSFINKLVNELNGKGKSLLIDGSKPNFDNLNIMYINDDNDFANEFKFTKSNNLRKIIYDEVIENINEEKIINVTNEIFDRIDNKVNKLLNKKINNDDASLSFQIEIPSVNSIIDKFTNIYIDDILINSPDISKAMKRKLLYQLYFADIKNNLDTTNIIVINDFDAYLSTNEIVELLNEIERLSNDNCHFILSTSSNIFEYISCDSYSIYKVKNKLISINIIDEAIKTYIIKSNYKEDSNLSYNEFYLESEHLISSQEIIKYKNLIFNKYPNLLGKILNCNNLEMLLEKKSGCDYIICSEENLLLFKELYYFFVD